MGGRIIVWISAELLNGLMSSDVSREVIVIVFIVSVVSTVLYDRKEDANAIHFDDEGRFFNVLKLYFTIVYIL